MFIQKKGDGVISRVIKPTDNFRPGAEVRLIDADNEQLGVLTIEDALDRADEAGLDLVLVAENGVPPVCRLMDFKKKQYEAKRSQRDAKKKQQAQKVKEVKFHATIDKHDFEIKVKNIRGFLDKGHKVKVSLYLRGREMGFKDQAMDIMNKVLEELNDIGTVEAAPKMINRSIHMVIANNPSKKK